MPSADAYAYPLLVKRLLQNPIVSAPDREIVYRGTLRLTYRDLHRRVAQLANALDRLGVRPGATVGVMDWDSHRYLECFFAVPMMGAVLHTINVRLSVEQILFTIEHAEDDVLLVHAEFLPILEHIRGRLSGVRKIVVLADEAEIPPSTVPLDGEYEALLSAESATREFKDLAEETRATTFYTTGTTGLPKGVFFSHRQLVLHTLGVLSVLGTATHQGRFHRGDVYMPITPMFHVHAWGIPYVATMLGVKQVYPGKYVPDRLLHLIATEGVTLSHCVPTILHMLLHTPGTEKVDLTGWKVLVGGAAMSKALCEQALARGIDAFAGYGMSETCPVLTLAQLDEADLALPPEAQAELRCKTGRPLPLVELKVADEALAARPRDGVTTGEIVVRAPWLTKGYLKEDRASDLLWRHGWLHTGDVAHQDGRGYVKITDRAKDVIKIGGEWVSSLELEDILAQHPGVAEVAVIGQLDPKWGERPLALVVARPEARATLDAKALRHHAHAFVDKGLVGRQAVLLEVRLVDSIDRTSVGKVNKVALRQKYLPTDHP
jgi:fatty-acyl-CoA synthase